MKDINSIKSTIKLDQMNQLQRSRPFQRSKRQLFIVVIIIGDSRDSSKSSSSSSRAHEKAGEGSKERAHKVNISGVDTPHRSVGSIHPAASERYIDSSIPGQED